MKFSFFSFVYLFVVVLFAFGQKTPSRSNRDYTITPLIASKVGLYCKYNKNYEIFVYQSLQRHVEGGHSLSYYAKMLNSFHKYIYYAEQVIVDMYEYAGDDAYFIFEKFLYPKEIELTERLWEKEHPRRLVAREIEKQRNVDASIDRLLKLFNDNPQMTIEDIDKHGYKLSKNKIYNSSKYLLGTYINPLVEFIGEKKELIDIITLDKTGTPELSFVFDDDTIISDKARQISECFKLKSAAVQLKSTKGEQTTINIATDYSTKIIWDIPRGYEEEQVLKMKINTTKGTLVHKIGVCKFDDPLFRAFDNVPSTFIADNLKKSFKKNGRYSFLFTLEKQYYKVKFGEETYMELVLLGIHIKGQEGVLYRSTRWEIVGES